ncbi:hypothetical protein [Campylobacter concisus]|uniref:hypothetical protein n=1 Tax=Campylobacter concisus TaxID=199 RepID=UPI001F459E8B|nr:hypothetical protein [Campylobacter concisus]
MQLRDKVEVKPDNVRGGMLQCFALHAVYDKETQANFKIYERAYHGSKFSAKRSAA